MQQTVKDILEKNSDRVLLRISENELVSIKNAIESFANEIAMTQTIEQKRVLINIKFGNAKNNITHLAAKFGDENSIKKILEHLNEDQDINIVNEDHFTPLHFAVINGDFAIVKLLLAAGYNKNAAASAKKRNWTPIHLAAQYNHADLVKLLIDAGVSKETKTSFGLTPLVIAAEFGANETLEFLLSIGADKNVQTVVENHKMTALHYAAIGNFCKTASILLEAGIEKDKETNFGFTALDFAAKNNLAEMASLLMCYGIKNWKSSLEVALENKSHDVVACIKKYQKAKLKLFNVGGLKNLSGSLINSIKEFSYDNLGVGKIVVDGAVFNAFGILSIDQTIGWINKDKKTFRGFVIDNDFKDLENELKRLDILVTTKQKSFLQNN